MKKNKGFTLIELLAVIVILAIVTLISVPVVLSLIEKTRKSAAQDNAYAIRKTAQLYYQISTIGGSNGISNDITISFNDSDKLNSNYYRNFSEDGFDMDGTVPTAGTITITRQGAISGNLVINGYTCSITNNEEINCEKETSSSNSNGGESNNQGGESNNQGGGQSQPVYTNFLYTNRDVQNYANPPANASFDDIDRAEAGVYLRYPLDDSNNVVSTIPDACLYSESLGGELCLPYNQYSTALTKIKEYFKWNDSTSSSQYSGVVCYTSNYNGSNYFGCEDENVHAEVYNDGSVITRMLDMSGSECGNMNYDESSPYCI